MPISIHAPTNGATTAHMHYRLRFLFQSTLRRTERQVKGFAYMYAYKFQSTLRRTERLKHRHFRQVSCNFNPRSDERSDLFCNQADNDIPYFNPRSDERSDMAEMASENSQRNFNPRSDERSDFYGMYNLFCPYNFNPRPDERSDHRFKGFQIPHTISIHAPTNGATSL